MRHHGVIPDLYVFSKSLANGYPLACVVGPREIMKCFDLDFRPSWAPPDSVRGPVYVSGTFSAQTVGLAAAKATLAVWERDRVAVRIAAMGDILRMHWQQAITMAGLGKRVTLQGPDYRLLLTTPSLRDRTALLSGMISRGQLIGAGANLTLAHTVEQVNDAGHALLATLQHLDEPAGRLVTQPYRSA